MYPFHLQCCHYRFFFFLNDTAPPDISPLPFPAPFPISPELADRLVADAALRGGELVVEVCAGPGPITLALARRAVTVVAVEVDPVWARRLRDLVRQVAPARVQVMEADILSLPLPTRPFRAIGSLPFGQTTSILRHLLDNPTVPLERADVVVQWEA